MDIVDLLKEYKANQNAPFDPFWDGKLWNNIPLGTKFYKNIILDLLQQTINSQHSNELGFYLGCAFRDGLDTAYKPILKQIVLVTWHEYHEDIVDFIRELKDDDFTDDLYTIAMERELFRQYDDEMEATLRKCIHALKAINSHKAIERLEQLKATGNKNVYYALEIYH